MKNTVSGGADTATESELTGHAMPHSAVAAPAVAVIDQPTADPAPLGLAAFGITTLILSVINSGWLGVGATIAVLSMALAYGGVTQFIAGLWAFRRGNTFAATAFCSYGAFWVSYYLLVGTYAAQIKGGPSVVSGFVGLYLVSWGIFTAYMTIASLAGPRAVSLVFVLLTITFVVLGIGEWAGSTIGLKPNDFTIQNLGGIIGLLTAVAALYASFADVLNANFKRVILPTGAH